MKDTNISISKYKFIENMLVYDKCSESRRILFYRHGFDVFLKNKKSFEQYGKFLTRRQLYKVFLFDCAFYFVVFAAILILSLDVFILKEIIWKDVFWTISRIAPLLVLNIGLFLPAKNNITQTKQFLAFIDSKNKKPNFNYFRSLGLDDEYGAAFLHKQMLSDDDFEGSYKSESYYDLANNNFIKHEVKELRKYLKEPLCEATSENNDQIIKNILQEEVKISKSNVTHEKEIELLDSIIEFEEADLPILKKKYNKTVKLLLIYFIFEEKHLNDSIDKLVSQSRTGLTKIGVYKTLSVIFGTSYINIKKFILSELEEVRTYKADSTKDLEIVRDVLKAMKLKSIANKVDNLIEETIAYKKKEKDMKRMG